MYRQAAANLFLQSIGQLHNTTRQAMESDWHLQFIPIMYILVLLHFHFYIQYITFRLLHFCHYQATSLRFTVGSR